MTQKSDIGRGQYNFSSFNKLYIRLTTIQYLFTITNLFLSMGCQLSITVFKFSY